MATHAASAGAAESTGTNAAVLAGLLAAGAGATVATVLLVARSDVLAYPHSSAVLRGAFVAAWVGVGTYMWWRRPDNRLGPLVAGAGFVYATTSFFASSDPLVHTLGRIALVIYVLYFSYIALCFPADRLLSNRDRRLMGGFVAAMAAIWPLVLLFVEKLPPGGVFNDCRDRCPTNALQVADVSETYSDVLKGIAAVATAAALITVLVVLVAKARSDLRLRRRAVEPVLYAFALVVAAYVANTLAHPTGSTRDGLRAISAAASLLLPAAMLIGQARARSYAATSLSQLVTRARGERVTARRMQELLRDALGDPTLDLALWDRLRSRFLDVDGNVAELATPAPGRIVSRVTHDGQPVAALQHNASLDEAAGVVDGLAETSLMLLENERLVNELRASRARIVATADQERHRLERDLHDGAQQRLYLLQIKLARLRRGVDDDLDAKLQEVEDDAAVALEELRVLAHGIYPTVLVERGVAEALRAFSADAPVPVRVSDRGIGRCSPPIEAALYYCALEALQNVAKHAGPDAQATVDLSRDGDRVALSVVDNGAGFGDAAKSDGIGLVTMRDRVGAVGGELDIESAPGTGVTVHVTIAAAPLRLTNEDEELSRWRSA